MGHHGTAGPGWPGPRARGIHMDPWGSRRPGPETGACRGRARGPGPEAIRGPGPRAGPIRARGPGPGMAHNGPGPRDPEGRAMPGPGAGPGAGPPRPRRQDAPGAQGRRQDAGRRARAPGPSGPGGRARRPGPGPSGPFRARGPGPSGPEGPAQRVRSPARATGITIGLLNYARCHFPPPGSSPETICGPVIKIHKIPPPARGNLKNASEMPRWMGPGK